VENEDYRNLVVASSVFTNSSCHISDTAVNASLKVYLYYPLSLDDASNARSAISHSALTCSLRPHELFNAGSCGSRDKTDDLSNVAFVTDDSGLQYANHQFPLVPWLSCGPMHQF
jgi:hypothetical protein